MQRINPNNPQYPGMAPIPPAPFRVIRKSRKQLQLSQFRIPTAIMITGTFGSGKTHVADMLALYGYERFSFAGVLRRTILDMIQTAQQRFNLHPNGGFAPLDHLYHQLQPYFRDARTVPTDAFTAIMSNLVHIPPAQLHNEVYGKPTSDRMRYVLQYFGTDVARKAYPYIWTKALLSEYRQRRPAMMVIDDWRFPEETVFWHWLGVRPLYIRLTAQPTGTKEQRSHVSELHIPELIVDYELYNGPDARLKAASLDGTILTADKLMEKRGVTLDTVAVKLHRPHFRAV